MAAGLKQAVGDWKTKLDKSLHESNKFTNVLAQIETKTGLKRLHIVLGFIALIGLYLMVGWGAGFLCNFIGFLYPAYASIKAIESPQNDDDTKWLTYWVVYSVLHLGELLTDVFFSWVPFYWLLKCILLVYCFAPIQQNGSIALYYKVIRPYVLKYETHIDAGVDKAKRAVRGVLNEAEGFATDSAADVRRLADNVKTD